MATQRSKHTIEVEVEWEEDGLHYVRFPFWLTRRVLGGAELGSAGITRPAPPYEPQVGDIVRLPDSHVDEVEYQCLGVRHLWAMRRSPATYAAEQMTLIHRPEVTK